MDVILEDRKDLHHQLSNSSVEATYNSGVNKPKVDVLLVVFVYLMMVVNNNEKSAELHAKNLEALGDAEIKYNQDAEKLNLVAIPSVKKQYKDQVIYHYHWGDGFTNPWLYKTKQVLHILVWSNSDSIAILESSNQKSEDARQLISTKLSVINQIGQAEQVSLNNTVNLASQSIQEGSGFLDMIKALTKKIENNQSR